VKFLGHTISSKGISVDPTKVQEVMDFIVGLPNTSQKHDSIWVILDRLTKTAHFLPVHTTYSAKKYAEVYLDQIV
jgi:hypothetical protein